MRRRIRWGLRHGLIRFAIRRGIKTGDLGTRLMVEPELLADPFPAYEQLRAQGRLLSNGMVLTALDHDLCVAVLRSPDFGVVGNPSGQAPAPLRAFERLAGRGPLSPAEPPSMLATDPPDHTRYRKLVSRAFSAKAVAGLRTRAEEIAAELLDEMATHGPTVDVVHEYASLLPATVIAEMLGAPVEMRRQLLDWGHGAANSLDAGLGFADFLDVEHDLTALYGWMDSHLDEVRRNPGQNILSDLVHARDGEGRLTDEELLSIAVLLLAAGFETTVNLIGNGIAQLTGHPEQLALLRADPALWPNAVEEVLRYDSPVQRTGRVAHRDTEVAGERIRAGQLVLTLVGAANRDPQVFADPQRFDVTRANAGDHVAFSSGVHYCLGAALAKMEGEVGLRALFDRFPDLVPVGTPQRRKARVLRGYDAMTVRLTASVDA
ncbi:cytochrome P450 [Pseudonocardia sp. GCM10023141]|uniref:cytochrome P450 n=1 Tax=Pseudonocardia sp. GCM10023141 TaxID=3252653 RepID=UPI0036159342